MAAGQNAKTLAYRSISKAAVFLFSYNLSFNPRTMFCVKGKKSFSAIAKKNRTTFGRNFTLRNTRRQAVILQAYHAVITLDPGLNCSKGHLKTPAKVHLNLFIYLFIFYFSLPSAMIPSLRILQCCFATVAYCTKCQFFFSRNEMQIAWFWTSDISCCSGNETGCPNPHRSLHQYKARTKSSKI